MVSPSDKDFNHIRTGVIGVGSMGQNHARIYNEISNLVAVADTNEEQGCKVAERFGVSWYGDYREMLDAVDAVTVAVPTTLHREGVDDARYPTTLLNALKRAKAAETENQSPGLPRGERPAESSEL